MRVALAATYRPYLERKQKWLLISLRLAAQQGRSWAKGKLMIKPPNRCKLVQ